MQSVHIFKVMKDSVILLSEKIHNKLICRPASEIDANNTLIIIDKQMHLHSLSSNTVNEKTYNLPQNKK